MNTRISNVALSFSSFFPSKSLEEVFSRQSNLNNLNLVEGLNSDVIIESGVRICKVPHVVEKVRDILQD